MRTGGDENGLLFNGGKADPRGAGGFDSGAGRLQIPEEYIEAMGLKGKNKIKVIYEEGKILLVPPSQEQEEVKSQAAVRQ